MDIFFLPQKAQAKSKQVLSKTLFFLVAKKESECFLLSKILNNLEFLQSIATFFINSLSKTSNTTTFNILGSFFFVLRNDRAIAMQLLKTV